MKYSGHIGELCGISCAVMDTVARSFVTGEINCDLCRRCNHPKRDPINTHLYGSNEAYRWNGRYIYYCPMGLVFVASSVSDERGLMTASLVAGPMVNTGRQHRSHRQFRTKMSNTLPMAVQKGLSMLNIFFM